MPELSVVVPVYNVDKYLNECVESILNQTFKELEVILVDDGSTDESGKICDYYALKDKRVRVVHQDNKGPSYARYIGVSAAEGRYVTFVDADDWLEEYAYEKVYKNIDDSEVIVNEIIQTLVDMGVDKNKIVWSAKGTGGA